jgi:sugar lactone lactonase YvrE
MKKICLALLVLIPILLMYACKKSSGGGKGTPAPSISSIDPVSGPMNTQVIITGAHFDTVASGNMVKFNGVIATVVSASASSLVVTVPAGAGTGDVTVTVSGQKATGPIFTYIKTTVVSTVAGNGGGGFLDGAASSAAFNSPTGVAVDGQGNIYVADAFNARIRMISTSGTVSTFAGNGTAGFADGGPTTAEFNSPTSVAVDAAGNIYVADVENQRIRKITASGTVSTYAGSGVSGFLDGAMATAQFSFPSGVALDGQGNLYVADAANNRVRKIISSGTVSTLAGNGTAGFLDGSSAEFNFLSSVCADGQGNIYVGDYNNNRLRKITPAGVTSTLAGSGTGGYLDGTGTAAQFNGLEGVACDADGNVYVADQKNNRIRMVTPSGIVTTVAGNGTAGFADGAGASAEFNAPFGVVVDGQGNVLVADQLNDRIRKISFE